MIDRRRFLWIAAAAAAAARLPADDAPDALVAPTLLAMLGPDAVRAVGRAYREREGDLAALAGPRATASAARDDFAAGRVVVVDGWVLAASEARECARLSLGEG